jgi:exodeoxyribonuclease III
MKIGTWNVNSIRSRRDRLLGLLARHQPDVLCLQELKCTPEQFPLEVVRQAGYHAAIRGEKRYNGVAILSRSEPADVRGGMDDGVDDPQARLISADIEGVRVLSAYVPNGSEVGSEKFQYKLRWLDRLKQYLEMRHPPGTSVVLCGDLNIARDAADAAFPDAWAETVLCVPPVRQALEKLLGLGLVDLLREQYPNGGVYTWWDYRRAGFRRDDGLRLDYILAGGDLAGRCTAVEVDRDERRDNAETKPSDHAPMFATFRDADGLDRPMSRSVGH